MSDVFHSRGFWRVLAFMTCVAFVAAYIVVGNGVADRQAQLDIKEAELAELNLKCTQLESDYKFYTSAQGIEMLARMYGLNFKGEEKYNVVR